MKKFTRMIGALLALAMTAVSVLSFVSCGTGEDDLKTIKENGKLVVGITEFEPMDYRDADGKWIGFDADAAAAFAEYLGVDVEFSMIDWNSKTFELKAGTIDCVWNGMTLTDEVKAAMETSAPYFNNAQVVIVKKELAESIKTVEDCKALKFAVEKGSAGQAAAAANGLSVTEVKDQATALTEVMAGTSDAAVIDFLMALSMTGEGTDYSSLTYTIRLADEVYGVGFRKGSNLAEKLNQFFSEKTADGTLAKIAEKYGIQDYLIKN